MKLLIISQYYYPEQFLITEIAEELSKIGHSVTVLTGLPNYPSGMVSNEYKYLKKRHEFVNGVEIIRCPEIPRGNARLIHLLFNYISYVFFASIRVLFLKDYDVVFSYQVTPVTQVIPAIIYSRLNKKPLLVYCMDLFPANFEHWTSKKGLFYRIVKIVSGWIYRQADILAVSSKSFIEYMKNVNHVPLDRIIYLPQHASDAMIDIDMTSAENGINDFMFAGNIGKGQNIETIIEAVEIIKEYRNFRVHLVGDGNNLENLKNLIKQKGLCKYFIIHGIKKTSEMPEIYKIADALLLTLRPGQQTIPSKLQTYMTTGKPIFGAIDGSAQEVIRESKCGVCAASGDASTLAKIMANYIDQPQKFADCGRSARAYFSENYSKDIFITKILALFGGMKNRQLL